MDLFGSSLSFSALNAFLKQIADLRTPGSRHRATEEFGHLPRRALCNLDGDIAAETLGDDDVGGALADAAPSTKPMKFSCGRSDAQQLAASGFSRPFISSTPMLTDPPWGAPGRTTRWPACPQRQHVGAERRRQSCADIGDHTDSPRAVGQIAAMAGRSIRAACASRTVPSPSARRCCRRTPPRRPRPS